jgi:hypothetical protein
MLVVSKRLFAYSQPEAVSNRRGVDAHQRRTPTEGYVLTNRIEVPSMRPFVLAVAFSLAAIPTVPAQERAVPVFGSTLADFMGLTQLRHIKLTFAGKAENWDLANYEVGQIRNSFAAAAVLYPLVGDVPFAKLVDEISEPALAQIESSIKTKNTARFWPAVEKLTEACNSCHQAAGFGFIRIHAATLSPFSDQLFEPATK